MMSAEMKREISEANRHRYEQLRAAGQDGQAVAVMRKPGNGPDS